VSDCADNGIFVHSDFDFDFSISLFRSILCSPSFSINLFYFVITSIHSFSSRSTCVPFWLRLYHCLFAFLFYFYAIFIFPSICFCAFVYIFSFFHPIFNHALFRLLFLLSSYLVENCSSSLNALTHCHCLKLFKNFAHQNFFQEMKTLHF
jgi:hypothetical protein